MAIFVVCCVLFDLGFALGTTCKGGTHPKQQAEIIDLPEGQCGFSESQTYRSIVAGVRFVERGEKISVATALLLIAALSVVLARAIIGGQRATTQLSGTSSHTLTKLERPHVYIRVVHGLRYADDDVGGIFLPVVKYAIGNRGKISATVDSISGGLSVGKDGPSAELPDASTPGQGQEFIYEPEREHEFTAELPEELDHTASPHEEIREICPILAPGDRLFLRIVVKYRGLFTGDHETSACWVLSAGDNRFVQFGGQEYNCEK